MYADIQLASLRKAYKKNLWLDLSAVFASLLFVGFMLLGEAITVPWIGGIAAGIGAAAAIADYIIEKALRRKGKKASFVLILCMILPLLLLVVVSRAMGLQVLDSASPLPYFAAFIFLRAAIPLIQLLRDGARLREGDLCETVGAVKKNARRIDGERAGASYLLFEDELTHEVHLLYASHISPLRRYRMFFLPHSGLAMGEEIPDNVTFDPFGNPIEREVTEEPITEAPPYHEESNQPEAPVYPEEETFNETEKPRDSRYDPNSPERQKAAKYATAAKVCKVLTFVCFGIVFVGAISAKVTDASPLLIFFFIPLIVVALLNSYFKNKELKLRCTKRALSVCIYTVRRRSGKHSHLHPVVEYEVDGRRLTAELSITCTRGAVGETYTIYYDPLEPTTVRVG